MTQAAATVPNHYVTRFTDDMRQRVQQEKSRLRHLVDEQNVESGEKVVAVDLFEETEAEEKTERTGDTPIIEVGRDRVWVRAKSVHWGTLVPNADIIRMLTDPTSKLRDAGTAAMKRKIDTMAIIPAFFGTMLTGKDADVPVTFPSSQQIDIQLGGGGGDTGMNVAKLKAASKKFKQNEVDLEEQGGLWCAITAQQEEDLLNEIETTSLDFNDTPVLVDGKITRFMGINFVLSERLQTQAADATHRRCPVWVKKGICLKVWEDWFVRANERDDKQYDWQIYLRQSMNATRTENELVVEIPCQE